MGTVPLPLDGIWKTAGTDLAVLVDITHKTTSPPWQQRASFWPHGSIL